MIVGFLEARRGAHDTIFKHAAVLVAHLVERLKHFLAEFAAFRKHRIGQRKSGQTALADYL